MENVFIERLGRSLKYECLYLNSFRTGSKARLDQDRGLIPFDGKRLLFGVITPILELRK